MKETVKGLVREYSAGPGPGKEPRKVAQERGHLSRIRRMSRGRQAEW